MMSYVICVFVWEETVLVSGCPGIHCSRVLLTLQAGRWMNRLCPGCYGLHWCFLSVSSLYSWISPEWRAGWHHSLCSPGWLLQSVSVCNHRGAEYWLDDCSVEPVQQLQRLVKLPELSQEIHILLGIFVHKMANRSRAVRPTMIHCNLAKVIVRVQGRCEVRIKH